MKNVLIICSSFPPQSEVGGLRPAMFAKYLKEFGWNPWVLTRSYTLHDARYDEKMPVELSDIDDQILRVPYSERDEMDYLKNRNIFGKIRDILYPEYSSPPGLFSYFRKAATHLMKERKFDLIFTTSPDQWELTLGSWISGQYNIPLLADFRDIKEQEEGLKRTLRARLQVFRFLFRRFITSRKASLVTTVSEFHAHVLASKLKRKTVIVYNGYDESQFKPLEITPAQDRKFRLVYIGRILDIWYRNPEILFLAIDQLISENKFSPDDIVVEFYGTEEDILTDIISGLKNPEFIQFYPRISFDQVPAKLNEAQMLLLLTNRDRKGIITTKFFEYAGVRKPILCIPGDGNELDALISKYELGYSISEVEDLKIKISGWVEQYRQGQFPVLLDSKIDFFTRKNQTRILAEAFDSIFDK